MLRLLATSLLCLQISTAIGAAEDPGKEIYGTDDRKDIFEETNPFLIHLARSVCALIELEDLRKNADGTFTILHRENTLRNDDGLQVPPCPDERFAQQPWAAFCSAFVVGAGLIATAGHCVDGLRPEEYRAVFGWEMIDANTPVSTLPADRVYQVAQVVHSAVFHGRDHAILRLDRTITAPGAVPLEVRRSGKIADNTPVGIIGHPLGLPKKIAFGPDTRVYGNLRPFLFYANFDASGGNSGSPVFDQRTGVVEGIYVTSDVEDFLFEDDCFRINRVDNASAAQGVMRSTTFAEFIPGNTPPKRPPICGPGTPVSGAQHAGDLIVILSITLFLLWHIRMQAK